MTGCAKDETNQAGTQEHERMLERYRNEGESGSKTGGEHLNVTKGKDSNEVMPVSERRNTYE